MNLPNDKEGSKTSHLTGIVVTGIFGILIACVSGAFLLINTLVQNGIIAIGPSIQTGNPNSQPAIVVVTATSQAGIPITIGQPETSSAQSTTGDCQETSEQSLSSLPSSPSEGCVLIVEWWVPPDANNCGISIISNTPVLPNKATGTWWNVYPTRPESHVQEFLQKNPQCKVDDQR